MYLFYLLELCYVICMCSYTPHHLLLTEAARENTMTLYCHSIMLFPVKPSEQENRDNKFTETTLHCFRLNSELNLNDAIYDKCNKNNTIIMRHTTRWPLRWASISLPHAKHCKKKQPWRSTMKYINIGSIFLSLFFCFSFW